jgi:cyclic beta-1,2-glucan synthetase
VDLGNLAAGLILLRQRIPELSARAGALLNAMEWDWLYDPVKGLPYGCRAHDGAPSTWWHYEWLAADSRLAHAIGIGTGKIPKSSWGNLKRTREPVRCYSPRHFEPGWDGGGLFMAFLPGIFLDEIGSPLGNSANYFVRDQICEAERIGAPAWGWSATIMPDRTYCGYGCERLEVLVPHASILAADYLTPAALMQNLQALHSLGTRPKVSDGTKLLDFGFRASVDWRTGKVTPDSLFLDQSMAFLSLVNKLDRGSIRNYICQDPIARRIKARIPDYANSCG